MTTACMFLHVPFVFIALGVWSHVIHSQTDFTIINRAAHATYMRIDDEIAGREIAGIRESEEEKVGYYFQPQWLTLFPCRRGTKIMIIMHSHQRTMWIINLHTLKEWSQNYRTNSALNLTSILSHSTHPTKPNSFMALASQLRDSAWFLGFFWAKANDTTWQNTQNTQNVNLSYFIQSQYFL